MTHVKKESFLQAFFSSKYSNELSRLKPWGRPEELSRGWQKSLGLVIGVYYEDWKMGLPFYFSIFTTCHNSVEFQKRLTMKSGAKSWFCKPAAE